MSEYWAELYGELDFTMEEEMRTQSTIKAFHFTLDERRWLVELLQSTPRYRRLTDPGDRAEIEDMCRQLLPECPICGQFEPHVCRERENERETE